MLRHANFKILKFLLIKFPGNNVYCKNGIITGHNNWWARKGYSNEYHLILLIKNWSYVNEMARSNQVSPIDMAESLHA